MASLTGQLVAETYKALLKTIDNDILTASEKQITDGLGGGSNVFIDSQGFLRANKYKVTNGLATQFLKADGSLDTNTYLTSITGAQVITALGYTPVPTTRTITINGETHDLSANNSWTIAGTSAVWGNITGILSNQTDLQNALNAKVPYSGATANVDLGENALLAEYLSIDTATTHVTDVGEIVWNAIDGTFDMGLLNGVTLQAGQELHFYGKASGAIGNGQAVMFAGVEGDHLLMSLADAATINANPQYFIGIATQDFANNDFGYVTVLGKVRNLDTTAYSLGAVLYYDSTNAIDGKLTTTMPIAPNAKIEVAAVVRVHATQGSLMVRPHIMPKLNQIQDVYIADPANNHGLFYDLANGYWRNTSIASVLGYTPQAQLNGTGFVKASGTTITYDNSTYLSASDAASTYLPLIGGTLTGDLTISSANPKLLLTDTDNNPDYSIQNYNGTFKISDETNSADRFFIYSTGIGYYNGHFKANKLYVEGGLSTQFIKGDGTLDTNTYLTATSLDGYLAKSGGTMTGDLNFYTLKTTRVGGNAYIRGNWEGTYWGLGAAATGHTIIIDQVDFSTGAYESITDVNLMLGTRTVVHSGNVATYALPITGGTVTGSITATSFVKSGGTSTQFLMADGSVTTLSSPVTGSGSAGYIPKWTTATNIGSSLIYDDGTSIGIAYNTPNKGGYGRTLTGASFGSASFGFEAVGGTTTNGGLVGGLSFILSQNDSSRIVGSAIQSNLVGTTATNYGADLRFYAKADAGVIGEVARMTSAGLRVYGTIVKDGGTASQYLMADGSVTTLSGVVTGSGTGNYITKWATGSIIGNSIIYDNGSSVGIGATTLVKKLEVITGNGVTDGIRLTYSNGVTQEGVDITYLNSGATTTSFDSLYNSAAAVMQFRMKTAVAPLTVMSIFGSGNISIGTTNDQGHKLAVNGSGRFYGSLTFPGGDRGFECAETASLSVYNNEINSGSQGVAGDLYFGWRRTNTLNFGASSIFSSNIIVNGSGSSIKSGNELRFYRSDNAIYTRMYDAGSLAANGFTFDNMNSEGFHFKNNGTTIMRMPSNGYVGINTTSPSAYLHINESSYGTGLLITTSSVSGADITLTNTGAGGKRWDITSGGSNNAIGAGGLQFYNNTDGSMRMGISTRGNVLINTTTDAGHRLYVSGQTIAVNNSTRAELRLQGGGYGTSYNASFRSETGAISVLQFGNNGENYVLVGNTATGGYLDFRTNCNSESTASGSPVLRLYANATAYFWSSVTASSFFESSDIRLKTLIESNPIINGIEKLEAKLYEKNGKIELGYFAQDAELIMPYAVTKNADGFLNLSYREIHTAKIARLEQRVAELEKQLNVA